MPELELFGAQIYVQSGNTDLHRYVGPERVTKEGFATSPDGANATIVSYNASFVKIYNATSSLARF
jgi:hypothetical protein